MLLSREQSQEDLMIVFFKFNPMSIYVSRRIFYRRHNIVETQE